MGRKHCGKRRNYEQFLLFPQCFQKACFPGASVGVIVWEWVKYGLDFRICPRKGRNIAGKGENAGDHFVIFQVQGMSFIAAVLLLNMEAADAFICFANLLNRPCQLAFFRVDESLVRNLDDFQCTINFSFLSW